MAEYIVSYVHQNRLGVIVKLHSDDGWATKTKEFQGFCDRLAMHIVAMEDDNGLKLDAAFLSGDAQCTLGEAFKDIQKVLGCRITLVEYCKLTAAK